MFDPDANMPRINREMAYLTSGIGGRSMNSRRLKDSISPRWVIRRIYYQVQAFSIHSAR
jgi:hypothetical protein